MRGKLRIITGVLLIVIIACSEQKEYSFNTLSIAVNENNIEAVKENVIAGVNINTVDSNGNTILYTAVENNNKQMVEMLLTKGIDPNISNEEFSALDLARKNKLDEIIGLIQKFQYNDWLKQDNRFSEEAFEYAVDNDNVKIITDFIANKRDPNAPFISKGLAPIIHAIFIDSYQVIFYLLDHGANPDITFDTRPAIATAALFNQYDVVKKLIEKGADVNFADGPFFTALMLASEEGNTEVVKLLLENGADKNLKDMN